MNPRVAAILKLLVLVAVVVFLFLLFPTALGFVEGAARNLRQLWWLILLIALACWLIWGVGRKKR
jgi:cytochrome bd-type quinol oxidase subunit 2